MDWESTLHTLPFIFIALAALWIAEKAWRHGREPGSLSFALLMFALCLWLVASANTQRSYLYEDQVLWLKISYIGIAWIPTLWISFALELAKRRQQYAPRSFWLLLIVPLISIGLVVTNDLHHWFWQSITISDTGQLIFHRGFWFWFNLVYNYALLAFGSGLLVREIIRLPYQKRYQTAALIIGMVIPWTVNISYVSGVTSKLGFDLTPYVFSIFSLLYAWLLFRMRLFDPAPLAREVIFEQISEGFLAFDDQDRLLDINKPALRMLGLGENPRRGCHAAEILSNWPRLLELMRSPGSGRVEIMAAGDPDQYFEAGVSPWHFKVQDKSGLILVLYDVTLRKQAEDERKKSEQTYRLLVESSPVGIVTLDEFGVFTFTSPEARDLLGVREGDDLVGTTLFDCVHPDDRALVAYRFNQILMKDEDLTSASYRMLRRDGQIFWADFSSSKLLGEGSTFGGLLTTIRDVTERKEIELRLERNLTQQTFINDLLQMMFRPVHMLLAVERALQLTGRYIQASRIYLCQDTPDHSETSIVVEWCDDNILPRAKGAPLIRYKAIHGWQKEMENQGLVVFQAGSDSTESVTPAEERQSTTPDDISEFMDVWGIQSLAVFPIYGAENHPFGFLGIDYCTDQRGWDQGDQTLIWNVCKIISTAVSHMEAEEAEQRQRVLTDALRDTTRALNSTLNPDEVLDQILASLHAVTPTDSVSIAMIDEKGMVSFERWSGYNAAGAAKMRTTRFHISEWEIYEWMYKTGDVILVPDTWLDRRWVRLPEFAWIRSYAGAPIQVKDRVVGIINLDSAAADCITPDAIERLRLFADQAGIAFENARLYNLAQQRVEEMDILYRIGLAVTANIQIDQLLTALFEQCQSVLPIDVFYVLLYDTEKDLLSHGIYYQEGEFFVLEPWALKDKPGLTRVVIDERRTIVIHDTLEAEAEGRYKMHRLGGKPSRSYVAVPLIMMHQVVGIISMQNFSPYAYSDEQVQLLETIASQAAIAIQNARLYEQMHKMAITDSVTQLCTRHHFTTIGHNEVERARRYNRALSVVMVDIDRFKVVNDTYGHAAGDAVLKVVAQTCKQVLRINDHVGRWGGEEFTILLPEANEDGAAMFAERIRRVVAETFISTPEGKTIQVTISLGVATLRPEITTLEDLVSCADKAMYEAKANGRNQVRVWKYAEDQ